MEFESTGSYDNRFICTLALWLGFLWSFELVDYVRDHLYETCSPFPHNLSHAYAFYTTYHIHNTFIKITYSGLNNATLLTSLSLSTYQKEGTTSSLATRETRENVYARKISGIASSFGYTSILYNNNTKILFYIVYIRHF